MLTQKVDDKSSDNKEMVTTLGKLREELSDTKTQWTLAKDQLRLQEEALRTVRTVKEEDEQRRLADLTNCKTRLLELDSFVAKRDKQLEELRFINRSLAVQVTELKKDSACMGQLLEDEVGKVENLAERERVVHQAETELKMRK